MTQPYQTIKIILADDHELFRDGVHTLLRNRTDIELVAEAGNGEQLITLTSKHLPDVVLIDIKMPVMDGVEATKIISERHPEVGIIALSTFDNDRMIINMLEAGALGYLLKNADKREVIEAITTVARHKPYYCSSTNVKLAQMIANRRFNPNEPLQKPLFTDKEKEIICQICQGFSNRKIAANLNLSTRTIESYRERILLKANAKNTAGLVVFAIKEGVWEA